MDRDRERLERSGVKSDMGGGTVQTKHLEWDGENGEKWMEKNGGKAFMMERKKDRQRERAREGGRRAFGMQGKTSKEREGTFGWVRRESDT